MKIQNNKQAGFTLVELLVALLIGLLLTVAIVTIYAGSQSTFRTAQGVSRSQEATRFAIHFLKTDIRQAGYRGCAEGVSERTLLDQNDANYIPSLEGSIFGWDYQGTGVGVNTPFVLNYVSTLDGDATDQEIQTARGNNTAAANMWNSRFILGANNNAQLTNVTLPPVIAALQPIQGSDIVSVTIAETLPLFVGGATTQVLPTVATVAPNPMNTNQLISTQTSLPTGAIISVGDCSATDTFQNTAQADNAFLSAEEGAGQVPGNLLGNFRWQKKWDEAASLYQLKTSVYFVGTGASGIPSLFRYSTNCGIIPVAGSNQNCGVEVLELVEGVENLQAAYGEDTNDDGVADQVLSANEVNDFENIVSVDLGILVRSVDSGLEADNTAIYTLAGSTMIDPPNDRFQRFVSNTTVRIENKGL